MPWLEFHSLNLSLYEDFKIHAKMHDYMVVQWTRYNAMQPTIGDIAWKLEAKSLNTTPVIALSFPPYPIPNIQSTT